MITEQQRAARKSDPYLGGSDMGAVLGISPYKTRLELYREKKGEVEPANLDEVEPVIFGNLLEDPTAKEFSRRTGMPLRRMNQTLIDPREPFLRGHIDRRVVHRNEVVEIKTVRGLDGDAPRADHVAQTLFYQHLGGFSGGWLVYLIAGQRLVWFEVKRDQAAIDAMLAECRTFWRHVQTSTPPPPSNSFDVRLLYPRDSGGTVIASDEVRAAADQLAQIKAMAKDLEAQAEAAEKLVLEALGENSTLIADTGEILATWKQAKPSKTFDRTRLEVEHPELAEQYLVEKPGSRRFLLKAAA